MRRLGARALADLFDRLRNGAIGEHAATRSGVGHDREEVARPWAPGDAFNLHLPRTVHNAVARSGTGVPVNLEPSDFEIVEHEALVRSATVLAIDLSMSMPMRDNFVPAKKMAIALATLIRDEVPEGLPRRSSCSPRSPGRSRSRSSRRSCGTTSTARTSSTPWRSGAGCSRKEHGTRQILVITDGEPTAHLDDAGEPYFHYPPTTETLRRDDGRGAALHPGGHHDQHVRPRPRADPVPLRRADRKGQRGPDLLPDAATTSGGYVLADFLAAPPHGCAPRAELHVFRLQFAGRITQDDTRVTTGVPSDQRRPGEVTWRSSSILGGLEERGWQARANCMGVDPDLFFPERGASTKGGQGGLPGLRRPGRLPRVRPRQRREVRDLGRHERA